jgi:hypothetical protein
MLTNEFCVRGKFWEKDPHTRSPPPPPPPLSVVGVSNIPSTTHQGSLWRSQKRKERLQGSLYTGWRSAPLFPTHRWKYHKEEPPHIGHQVRGGPHRKMCGGNADELGELPCQ